MNQSTTKKSSGTYIYIILIVLVAVILAAVVLSIFTSPKVVNDFKKAVTGKTSSISLNEMAVYRFQIEQQEFYYAWMYDYYGWTQNGYTQQFSDPNSFAAYMCYYYTLQGVDEFDADAYKQSETYLTYYEAAKAEGVKLSDKNKKDVDDYIATLESAATVNEVSLDQYITMMMGEGVTKSAVKSALKKAALAGQYADQLKEEYANGKSDADIEAYLAAHKSDFYKTDYSSYVLSDAGMKSYIEGCKTVDEVKDGIFAYLTGDGFDTHYNDIFTGKSAETANHDEVKANVTTTLKAWLKLDGLTEDDAVYKAPVTTNTEADTSEADTDAEDTPTPISVEELGYNLATSIYSVYTSETGKVTSTSATYFPPEGKEAETDSEGNVTTEAQTATALQAYLFNANRKAGDLTVIEDGTILTWVLVGDKVLYLDDEKTVNAYVAVLADDTATEDNADVKTADQKYNEFVADKTGSNFESVFGVTAANVSATDTSYPEEIITYLFNAERKEGDSEKISVKTSSADADGNATETTTDYMVLFNKLNEENWKMSVRDTMAGDEMSDWLKDAKEKYEIKSNYVEPETEADTQAAANMDDTPATAAGNLVTEGEATEGAPVEDNETEAA